MSESKFEDIEISTMTIIGITNWNLNIERLFDQLDTVNYVVIPKKRGRKKKEVKEDPNKHIKEGDIITLKYKDQVKGVDLKKKKTDGTKKGYFRNSITVVMHIDGKLINFKISKNGKFQITGCKKQKHAELCTQYIWNNILNSENFNQICKIKKNENPSVIFITMMTNIDFNIGFNVNREALDDYINTKTHYNSILETSFGYTGVNIKIPLDKTIREPDYHRIMLVENKWVNDTVTHDQYFATLSAKDQKKEMNKTRYNTFLVFHSGNVILSSKHHHYMKSVFNTFSGIIDSSKKIIQENVM
jgi:TATA-box binding protein (TBP) (component of TFIID and TFIIIB)